MKTHSSLNLSRWLHEKGFRGESDWAWYQRNGHPDKPVKLLHYFDPAIESQDKPVVLIGNSYDLLNDLCIKYTKEIWGSNDWYEISEHRNEVMYQIHHGSIEEAEKYIMENSILNK